MEYKSEEIKYFFSSISRELSLDALIINDPGQMNEVDVLNKEDNDELSLQLYIYRIDDRVSFKRNTSNVKKCLKNLRETETLVFWGNNSVGISKWVERTVNDLDKENVDMGSCGISIRVLEKLIKNEKKPYAFYYPYPNLKITKDIYSDGHMPTAGFNFGNTPDYDNERIQLRDQSLVVDTLIENDMLKLFFDSFICIVGTESKKLIDQMEYLHFSTGRDALYQTVTVIPSGKQFLTKKPFSEEAIDFVDDIYTNGILLKKEYTDSKISINNTKRISGKTGIEIEYIKEKRLGDVLDGYLLEEDITSCLSVIEDFFANYFNPLLCEEAFCTQEFARVFGELEEDSFLSLPYTNVDCIFDNVYVDSQKNYIISDCEWTFSFPIPVKYVQYRCIHYFLSYRRFRFDLLNDCIWDKFNISPKERKIFSEMEKNFQNIVTGVMKVNNVEKDNWLLKNVYAGFREARTIQQRLEEREHIMVSRVKFENEDGTFSNEYTLEGTKREIYYSVIVEIKRESKRIWISPASIIGLLNMRSVTDEKGRSVKYDVFGMKQIGPQSYIATSRNPYIIINNIHIKKVFLEYRYDPIVSINEYANIPENGMESLEQEQLVLVMKTMK